MEKETFLLKLSLTRGIGVINKDRIYRFAKKHGQWVFNGTEIRLLTKAKNLIDWDEWTEEKLATIRRTHAFFTIEDECYPAQLKHIPTPPLVLFYKGNIDLLKQEMMGIVGARKATDYGYQVVRQMLPDLVKHRFAIVSGLAKGIDAYAHQFTISNHGKTIGVIGTGLDVCYPRESGNLQIEMARNQLVLSEYLNGTPPNKFHFPMRNRIIAGLSGGILVVEAKKRSGSLITAQQALEYGREVFAVPGDILSGGSSGCHQLIQDGAICVEKPQDIFDSYQLLTKIC